MNANPGRNDYAVARVLCGGSFLASGSIVAVISLAIAGNCEKVEVTGCDRYFANFINLETFTADIADYLRKLAEDTPP
jgi:hypothetical protein